MAAKIPQQNEFVDHYKILGVDPSASNEEIQKAYRRLARQYHPDVNKTPEAAEKIKYITVAYGALGSPKPQTQENPTRDLYNKEYYSYQAQKAAASRSQTYGSQGGGGMPNVETQTPPPFYYPPPGFTTSRPEPPSYEPPPPSSGTSLAPFDPSSLSSNIRTAKTATETFSKGGRFASVGSKIGNALSKIPGVSKLAGLATKALTALSHALKAVAAALNAIPILGTILSALMIALPLLARNTEDIVGAFVGAIPQLITVIVTGIIGLIFAAIGLMVTPIVLTLLGVPLLIAFIIFIINAGAYVVPPADPLPNIAGPVVLNPGTTASGSCPLVGSVNISTGSYDPITETGHGSNSYWTPPACSYPIPVLAMYPGCAGPSVPGSETNVCRGSTNTCPYYGFAADVSPTGGGYPEVVMPFLCDQGQTNCPPLNWTKADSWYNCNGQSVDSAADCPGGGWGWGVIFTANGNGHSWKLYLNHISQVPSGSSFQSGTVIGNLSTDLSGDQHVHIELNIDGVPVRPEFMCSGSPSVITNPGDLQGWYAVLNPGSLIASQPTDPSQVGIGTCTWAPGRGLSFAFNGSFGRNSTVAIGPTGYNGQFTNNPPLDGVFDFKSFVITNSGQAMVLDEDSIPSDPAAIAAQYKLAVTGVPYNHLPETSRPRTIIGTKGSQPYVVILRSATPAQSEQFMTQSLGITNGFFLDGGGSTTLCSGDGTIIFEGEGDGTPRALSSHVGVRGGSYQPINQQ